MAGKSSGYIIGGIQILAGVALEVFSLGTLSAAGIPLIVSGVATIVGTALTPSPPRQKTLRDSPHYGIDVFENPRGPDAFVPILFGTHRVKPVVISESVSVLAQEAWSGIASVARQRVRWLGVVSEGELANIEDVEINDVRATSDLLTAQSLGTGNGSKKTFDFPHKWVYLGGNDTPAVDVFVSGVKKSYTTRQASQEFTVPAPTAAASVLQLTIARSNRVERVLEGTIRVFVRGTGHPESEQLRRVGLYRWSVLKIAPWKVRVKFARRPPTGFTVRVTYDYLGTDGLAITQDGAGVTKAVFGTAPANNAAVTASYRTTPFRGLRMRWTRGTLDQAPLEGFTDLEQSRNPNNSTLVRNTPQTYSTDGREVDDLRFGIVAPQGFIRYESDGGTEALSARVRIEYRKLGASAWTVLRRLSGNDFTLVEETSSAARWEIPVRDCWQNLVDAGDVDAMDKLEAFERGAYEARVTRLTAQTSDPLVRDILAFAYVTEVLHQGFSYPGTSLLAVDTAVGAALAGSTLRVSCLATRAPLYDPRTPGGSRDIGSTENAALAIRDLVTSAEGAASERYGGGFFFGGGDLFVGATAGAPDKDSWVAFADFCDEWVRRPGDDPTRPASATNGERRCRLNLLLDTPQSLMETACDIAFLGWCFASLQGARWRFPLDQDGDPVFAFVDDVDPAGQNMSKFVLRMDEWGKTPTAVKGQFWNERIDYQRDEMHVPVAGLAEGVVTNVVETDLRGCTRETEAARLLRHLAEQARSSPFPCAWESHPGVQHVEAGDVVAVKTRTPYSTGNSAVTLKVRVLAATVGRDENGKLSVRYAGRVLSTNVYALQSVTVPSTAKSATVPAASTTKPVTDLTAKVN